MTAGTALPGHVQSLADPPIVIVTTCAGEQRSGCVVGFSTQCSIKPPRWLVCISEKNATFDVVTRADVVAVHVLAQENRDLAELFGGETDDEIDKFTRCSWQPGPGGVPILDGCPAWMAGPIVDRRPVGDHTAVVFDLDAGEVRNAAASVLRYRAARSIEPGHAP